jgi:mono/diheme cytochrome c family protein
MASDAWHGARTLLALLALACACGDGARDAETADTAVLAARAADSIRRSGGAPAGDSAGDTAGADRGMADAGEDTAIAGGALEITLGTATPADSASGDSLYRRRGRCLTCHGRDAAGLANLGPSLRDGEWLHGDGSLASIASVIAAGVNRPKQAQIRMPAFAGELAPAEIARLAAYVYRISHPDSGQ